MWHAKIIAVTLPNEDARGSRPPSRLLSKGQPPSRRASKESYTSRRATKESYTSECRPLRTSPGNVISTSRPSNVAGSIGQRPQTCPQLTPQTASTPRALPSRLRQLWDAAASMDKSAGSSNLQIESAVQRSMALAQHSQSRTGSYSARSNRDDAVLDRVMPVGVKDMLELGIDELEYLATFKAACKRNYRNLTRAWRLLLDAQGLGRISFISFCETVRQVGWKDGKKLFMAIDGNHSGFITLDEWDPVSHRNLMEFKDICKKQFGGMESAFNHGMDRTGSKTVTLKELERFCNDQDFTGDVKVLFEALAVNRCGFITLDNLDFLQVYEGERFTNARVGNVQDSRSCKFNYCLARLRNNQDRRRQMRDKWQNEQTRLDDDKDQRESVRFLNSPQAPADIRGLTTAQFREMRAAAKAVTMMEAEADEELLEPEDDFPMLQARHIKRMSTANFHSIQTVKTPTGRHVSVDSLAERIQSPVANRLFTT